MDIENQDADATSATGRICLPDAGVGGQIKALTPAVPPSEDPWSGLSRDLIERFIESSCIRQGLPRSVRRGYRGDLVAFDNWMRDTRQRTLVSSRASDVRSYIDARAEAGIEVRLLCRLVNSLQGFFHYLRETGCRNDNPARRLRHAAGRTPQHAPRNCCSTGR
ncbi:MAG: site-specific integrase [Pseudomonadota bacterium]